MKNKKNQAFLIEATSEAETKSPNNQTQKKSAKFTVCFLELVPIIIDRKFLGKHVL